MVGERAGALERGDQWLVQVMVIERGGRGRQAREEAVGCAEREVSRESQKCRRRCLRFRESSYTAKGAVA